MVVAAVGVTLISFVISHAVPSDPVVANLGQQASQRPEIVAAYRARWGLDQPLHVQYLSFVGNLAHGELGTSLNTRHSISQDVKQFLPATLELSTVAILFALVLGLPLGILSAIYRDGLITRVTRSSLLEVLGQDYVRTARAKGLVEHTVVVRHALRNALIPTVTVLGLAFGSLLSGAVMTETIFAWPGLGRYAYQAAVSNDFPSIMGVTFVIALMYIVVNLAVDLTYALLDPQIRYA